jgi:formate-dependent nitrite reductase cytochrome c552 subunit
MQYKVTEQQAERIKHRMKVCLNCHSGYGIEWDHAFGRTFPDDWNLQPLCTKCHRLTKGSVSRTAKLKSMIRAIKMGLEEDILIKYPKRDWRQELKRYQIELAELKETFYKTYNPFA